MSEYEPKILGFLCNWCSYAGADLAGVSRVQYPPNMRVIRVMCSGRVEPRFVIQALELGLDGVYVMGCHLGDCHYLDGNYEAVKKYEMTEKFLSLVGLKNRIRLDWVSASEGQRFGEVVTKFVNDIRDLGPSPLSGDNPDLELVDKLKAIKMAVSGKRMRALVGRQRNLIEEENVYGEKIDEDAFLKLFDQAIQEEYERHQVLVALDKGDKSVKDIAAEIQIDPSVVLDHMIILKARAEADFKELVGNTPIFMRVC
ncbi:MAG: hydrogenase iron-sulfur subunit [Promethearchaeota archaeon]|nr:MAG: hydrogenase iron-sulfur subunit [Candidatus Lokiarchaeota archaeon]